MKAVCPTLKSNEEHSLFPVLRKQLCISLYLQKVFPLTQMLKLGKVVESPEVVNLYQFDLSRMRWSTIPKAVEFNISKDLLGEGAFRRAYKARTDDKELSAFTWVVKEYTTNALEVISETNQSVEAHTRKVVQMYCLAQNFANQLRQEIEKANLQESFGPTLHVKYGNIYLGKKVKSMLPWKNTWRESSTNTSTMMASFVMAGTKSFLKRLNAKRTIHMKSQTMSSCYNTFKDVDTGSSIQK